MLLVTQAWIKGSESIVSHSSLQGASGGLSGAADDLDEDVTALRTDLGGLGDIWGHGLLGATLGDLDTSLKRRLFERCAELAEEYRGSSGKVGKMSDVHHAAESEIIRQI